MSLTIHTVTVKGNQRLEPETVRAYANLYPGQTYTRESLDAAIKALYATGLFADATITGTETGDLVINVRENPVINRIVLEGNKRLKTIRLRRRSSLLPGRSSRVLQSDQTFDTNSGAVSTPRPVCSAS